MSGASPLAELTLQFAQEATTESYEGHKATKDTKKIGERDDCENTWALTLQSGTNVKHVDS